jgi:hypothetical protein
MFLVLLVLFGLGRGQETCFPDLPCANRPLNLEEFSSCTVLVPLDFATHVGTPSLWGQSIGSQAVFNLKVYGLIVKTLWSDIPLRWIIKSRKRHGDVDFVKNVTQLTIGFNQTTRQYFPVRGATWAMRTFSGSAFALPVHQTAKFLQVADAYMRKHALSGASALRFYVMSDVQPATADPAGLFLPVAHRIDRKPYGAVFDSTGNAKILLGILEAAGLEREKFDVCGDSACPLNTTVLTPGAHYRILNKDDAGTIDDKVCLSFASEPHFAASKEVGGALPFVMAARKFVLSGGNFLAQCHSIDSYESCDLMKTQGKTCAGGGTLSVNGIAQNGAPGVGCTTLDKGAEVYPSGADLPIVQFEGPWTHIGGSVTSLCDGAGNHTKFYNEPTGRFGFWVHGFQGATASVRTYHVASGSSNRSEPIGYRYFFLTGHSYKPEEAGARVFLNAFLIPANRRRACGFVIEEQFVARKRQAGIGAIKVKNNPGDACSCTQVFDACGVCGGTGKKGIDGCGKCDGDGTYVDYCGECRRTPPFRFADQSLDIGCCGDGLINQNEENVDCGGVCAPCTPQPTPQPTPVGGTPIAVTPVPPTPVGSTPFPTPTPVGQITPTPSAGGGGGGGGAACEVFEVCSTCVGHPLRACTWCGSSCQPSDSTTTCDAQLVRVPSRGNCTAAAAAAATTTTTTTASAGGTPATPTPTSSSEPVAPPVDGSCFAGRAVAGASVDVGELTCVCDGVRLLCFTRTSAVLPADGSCFPGLNATGALAFVYDEPRPFCACLARGIVCTSTALSCGLLSFAQDRCEQRGACEWREAVCVAAATVPATNANTTASGTREEEIITSSAETTAKSGALGVLVVAVFLASAN